jgi:GTP-binding protein EngB required for normal cell division
MYLKIDLKMKKLVKELSVSVAYMLDDLDKIKQRDVEHLQDLITELENKINPTEKGNDGR